MFGHVLLQGLSYRVRPFLRTSVYFMMTIRTCRLVSGKLPKYIGYHSNKTTDSSSLIQTRRWPWLWLLSWLIRARPLSPKSHCYYLVPCLACWHPTHYWKGSTPTVTLLQRLFRLCILAFTTDLASLAITWSLSKHQCLILNNRSSCVGIRTHTSHSKML